MANCKHCESTFEITQEDRQFYNKVSPLFKGVKYLIPEPTLCPNCRRQRRLSWRNERHLYNRKSSKDGSSLISNLSPDKPYKVYSHQQWWNEDWDGLDYGRDFDFSRPFFEQFSNLLKDVPFLQLVVSDSQNCNYCNYAWNDKDCYLLFDGGSCEQVYFSDTLYDCKTCFDCLTCQKNCELCYECVDCSACYKCTFCIQCSNASNLSFCFDCSNSSDCFMSFNLRGKKYCIENKQYSKEEYERIMSGYDFSNHETFEKLKKRFFELKTQKAIHHFSKNLNTENSSGALLNKAKNSQQVFNCVSIEGVKYAYDVAYDPGGKTFYDDDRSGMAIELSYETMGNPGPYASQFVISCGHPKQVTYAYFCYYLQNCFGCVGLKKKQYCVLNKQYSKEEYEVLVPKIIAHMQSTGEWGEFFPTKFSPFAYNETLAQNHFPLSKTQVHKKGWAWKEDWEEVEANRTIPASKLPNKTQDIPNDLLNWAIECEVTGKPFKVILQELNFYRQNQLPIPRKHPHQRALERFQRRNPYQLWHRSCSQCTKQIQSSYAPERTEKVYCEECYLKEVY